MKTIEFTLPSHFASALINRDYSGLNNDDIKLLDNFEAEGIKKYGRFYCIDVDVDNISFSPFNDITGMRNTGSDICTFTFDITPLSI